jgi:hypothetical protein
MKPDDRLKKLAAKGPNSAKIAAAITAMQKRGWTLEDVKQAVKK